MGFSGIFFVLDIQRIIELMWTSEMGEKVHLIDFSSSFGLIGWY